MSDIFREIDEELRRDSLQQLWQHYGKYIIGLAVVIVIATAGVMGWRSYQDRQAAASGTQYAAALDLQRQGKASDAAAAFAEVAQHSASGLAVLARFEEAASKVKAGDAAGAEALYDQLAADGSVTPEFHDAATVLAARYGLDKGDPKAVIAKLQPLAAGTSPWHALAAETIALAELKAGDTAKAKADFEALAKDGSVSQSIKERATVMAQTIAP